MHTHWKCQIIKQLGNNNLYLVSILDCIDNDIPPTRDKDGYITKMEFMQLSNKITEKQVNLFAEVLWSNSA